MNRERAKELLPILQAFVEGKTIQFAKDGCKWGDLPDNENLILTFPADDYDYRIKPEPRVFWVHENMNQVIYDISDLIGWTPSPRDKYIKVIEVLEDE